MKIWLLIGILLVFSTILVSAKTIEMDVGDTWTGIYRKATLTNLNRESAIMCVNNQKFIIKEGARRTLNNVIVELKEINYLRESADIYFKESCNNCFRDESYFNKKCLIKTDNDPIIVNNDELIEDNVELIGGEKVYYSVSLLPILFAVVLVLGLLYFLLFRFR